MSQASYINAASTVLPPLTVLVGHYGVGKTNLALNLALEQAGSGRRVTVVDMDIVNPYFRSSDYESILKPAGIGLIAPNFAGTSIDTPSLSPAVKTALSMADDAHAVLLDVGGDDAGATSLGRYADDIQAAPAKVLYVVNARRATDGHDAVEEAIQILREIEESAHMPVDALINNTHMQDATTMKDIEDGWEFVHAIAQATQKPIWAHTVPNKVFDEAVERFGDDNERLIPVRRLVIPPWNQHG